MTSYPLPTLAAQVTADGISAPSYDDTFLSLQASYQAIYGTDVVLTPDTQDGQWLGILAQAFTDVNGAAIAVYNSFSPATARGNGLARMVKINGLSKQLGSNSTCPVLIGGTAGTTITNGRVEDTLGNFWTLPATVIIPPESSITVTATAEPTGVITAGIGTITKIATPTLGWLTVTNEVQASPGSAVEGDPALRQRQTISTSIAAVTPLDAIIGAVADLPGVSRIQGYENDTNVTDTNGLPGHSICLVVEGGSATDIAHTIALKLGPGPGTVGTISEVVNDAYGVPRTIRFDTPTYVRVVVNVTLKALTGYTAQIGNDLVKAIVAYVSGLTIGENVYLTQVITAAIQGSGGMGTFNLTSLTMAAAPGTPSAADIPIAFDHVASLVVADVTLTLAS